MITPIRGRKLIFSDVLSGNSPRTIRNDNPDKGTETVIRNIYFGVEPD